MKTISKAKSAKENQGGEVWEKVPATSSLYRYIPKGTFYMVARIKGKLVRECLETTDLALAKRKLPDAKDRRKTQVGEITLLQLAEEFKASRNGKNQKHIDWMIKKVKDSCPFKDSIVRKINPIEISKFITGLKLNPRTNNLFFETLKTPHAKTARRHRAGGIGGRKMKSAQSTPARCPHFTTPWQRMNSICFGDGERIKRRALEQASVLFSAN